MSAFLLRSQASGPQAEFVNSTARYPALVAGFGAGKTQAGVLRALRLKFAAPKLDVAYYLPTYDLVRLIGYARFPEILTNARVKFKLNESKHVLTIKDRGRIIFRTLDNPERIVGYEVADSIVDELDTLKLEDARHAWQKIIARNRQKKPGGAANSIAVATTPEGFRFVYERWHRDRLPGYDLIRASTYSNARNLPDDYIESLKASYPAQLIDAYIEGKFVNLTAGSVYPDFSRDANHCDAEMLPGEPLHIGLDFNVFNCTAIVNVIRADQPMALDEITGVRDTPAMAQSIKEQFPNRRIVVYPDASGKSNRTVNASISDLQILKDSNFEICVPNSNPLVKERVMSMNSPILNGKQERRFRVNTRKCKTLTECLEQQSYDKNGEPDKSSGKDHAPDAQGYFINYRWPIVRKTTTVTELRL